MSHSITVCNSSTSAETFVGFANLPNQVHRKIAKRGFEFTLMVVGPSGLGKSTLINSLFLSDLYPDRKCPIAAQMLDEHTVRVEVSTVEIEERGVRVRLTLVDTPGYNDSLDATDCYRPIIDYIDQQFDKYLTDESGLNRRNISDNRVHCVFFFVSPFGRGLRTVDLNCLRALQAKANIVPIIGRADALTRLELSDLKSRIMQQLKDNNIKIYEIPSFEDENERRSLSSISSIRPIVSGSSGSSMKDQFSVTADQQIIDEDVEFYEQNRKLREAVPFAVCGSQDTFETKGSRRVRGRMYQWGMVDIENGDHCDFVRLRTMLTTHMQDLQEITHEVHYEQFRSEKLNKAHMSERILKEKEEELRAVQEMLAKVRAEMAEQKVGDAKL